MPKVSSKLDAIGVTSSALQTPRFYLASRSSRRRELLAQACYSYAELPAGAADVDETPRAGELAAE